MPQARGRITALHQTTGTSKAGKPWTRWDLSLDTGLELGSFKAVDVPVGAVVDVTYADGEYRRKDLQFIAVVAESVQPASAGASVQISSTLPADKHWADSVNRQEAIMYQTCLKGAIELIANGMYQFPDDMPLPIAIHRLAREIEEGLIMHLTHSEDTLREQNAERVKQLSQEPPWEPPAYDNDEDIPF